MNYTLLQITNVKHFWILYDAVTETNINSRNMFLQSYKEGTLYGLKHVLNNILTCIPCFCICKNKFVLFLWVHPTFRNKGVAKHLLRLLHAKVRYINVNNIPTKETISPINIIHFFEKCNIICVI